MGLSSSKFESTRWSLVLSANDSDADISKRALGELCQAYWYPLYAFVRRQGLAAADAEDAIQEFFFRFLKREDFARIDRDKGRLRSYLLGALKHFLSNEAAKANAEKRGGGKVVSLDREWAENQLEIEPASDEWSPEKLYDRRWALTQLEAARQRVADHFEKRGKAEQFDVLAKFLAWNSGEDYASAAAELEISESAVRVAVHRLRQKYRDALRAEIADTVDSNEALELELKTFADLL